MRRLFARSYVSLTPPTSCPNCRSLKKSSAAIPQPQELRARDNGFFDFLQDLRYAARTLRKSPGFTAVAALTLALGIGANTAIFTIIDTLVLNPLPVTKISELAAISTMQQKMAAPSGEPQPMSFLNFRDFRKGFTPSGILTAHSNPMAITMSDEREPRRIFVEVVTANYFDTLGLRPFMGRFFLASEDITPGIAAVAVLGYSAWQSRFGGAADIVGKTVKLNNMPFTIIGIGPRVLKGFTLFLARIYGYRR